MTAVKACMFQNHSHVLGGWHIQGPERSFRSSANIAAFYLLSQIDSIMALKWLMVWIAVPRTMG